jgi:hypothetical protein
MIKHYYCADVPDRPVFMKMVEETKQPTFNGYTLQLDLADRSASIINLTKGGEHSMLKTVVKALEGFEKQFDDLNEMKANLDTEIEAAKKVAIEEVEARFAIKSERIDNALKAVSETVEVEVEDEITEVVETEDAVEETPVVAEEPASLYNI